MHYVSLHGHSTYSYGDGFGLPEAHVDRAAELGMKAIALTEHGNVSSHVKLELAAKKHAVFKDEDRKVFDHWTIKPIFGLEAYTAPADMRETQNMRKWHLTLLAMNLEGYQNLMKLTTRSWQDDFYRWPTVLGASLSELNAGLIVLSGCADSHLACTLFGGKGIPEPIGEKQKAQYQRNAVKVMLGYKKLLGDRYYLEVQRFPGLARTKALNKQYALWSKEYDIPLVATSDVHYPMPEDNEMQKILHAASRSSGTVAAAEAEWEYDILLTYPLSDDEIMNDLIRTGLTRGEAQAAIVNTEKIAERCNVEIPKMDRIRYPGTTDDLKPWPERSRVKRDLLSLSPHLRSSASGAVKDGATEASISRAKRTKRGTRRGSTTN